MKSTLKNVFGALSASAVLVALPAFADQPGKGWDTFRTGAGEPISVPASGMLTSMVLNGTPGKGWDTFHTGAGEPIGSSAQMGKAISGIPGKGWDTFHAGAGEPIPASRPLDQHASQ